jgi:hypothetical protein
MSKDSFILFNEILQEDFNTFQYFIPIMSIGYLTMLFNGRTGKDLEGGYRGLF